MKTNNITLTKVNTTENSNTHVPAMSEKDKELLKYFEFKEIHATEIRRYEPNGVNMPILVLTNEYGMNVGYLSPFRGYCFQVSRTFDGQWDKGSSQVMSLKTWLDIQPKAPSNMNKSLAVCEALKGQALIALAQFSHGDRTMNFLHERCPDYLMLSDGKHKTQLFDSWFDVFIYETCLYLGGSVDHLWEVDD